jgi:hypothetical protein
MYSSVLAFNRRIAYVDNEIPYVRAVHTVRHALLVYDYRTG